MKRLLNSIDRANIVIGPWLFYVALVLSFVSVALFYGSDIPYQIRSFCGFITHVVKWICYLRISLMVLRHPLLTIAYVLVIIMMRYSSGVAGHSTLWKAIVLIAASRGTKSKTVIYIFLVMISLQLLIALGFHFFGKLGELVKHRYGLVGHSWGTASPNSLAAWLFVWCNLCLLRLKNRNLWVVTSFCLMISLFVFFSTLSVTVVIVLSLLPLIYWCVTHIKISDCWMAFFPWLCVILSLTLMFYYAPSYGESTFESRFGMARLAFENYGFSWLGQRCEYVTWQESFETGTRAFCVDNAYLRLLLYHGVVPTLIMISLISYSLYVYARQKNPLFLSIGIGFLMIGFMESYLYAATLNFTLLCFLSCENMKTSGYRDLC